VNLAPNATLSQVGPFCSTDPVQTLTQGSPSGGVYSGTGVSGNTFSPISAGVGSHMIKYVVTSTNGCKDSATTTVGVSSGSSVSATAMPAMCENDAAVMLTNGSPTGGVYSGSGVSSGVFNPSVSGSGLFTIKYVVGSGSCKDSTTFTIRVNAKPNVTLSAIGPFCSSDPVQSLTQGSPSGGVYFGNGVSSGSFTPSTAGVGSHLVSYAVTGSNGCSDTATTTVVVSSGTTPTLGSFSDMCVYDSSITLSGGSPSGGTFLGSGVINGIFDPAIAGVGTHTISYSHPNACGKLATSSIKVIGRPVISTSGDTSVCPGDAVRLQAIGARSYSWTPTGSLSGAVTSTPMASPVMTTTYVVMGTDSGCVGYDSLTVVVHPSARILAGNGDTTCSGKPIQLQATGGVSYTWTPTTGLSASNIANPIATLTSSQTYQVQGVDANGCRGIASASVHIKANPQASISSISPVCAGDSAFSLTGGSPTGGNYSGMAVSGGMFDPSQAQLGLNTVYYTITDSVGCTGKESTTVEVRGIASITWANKFTLCQNEAAVQLAPNPNGGTYSGISVSNNQIDPQQLGVGKHKLVYSFTDSIGCKTVDNQVVTVNPSNPISSVQGIFNAIINRSYSYQVKAVNGASYTWTLTGGRFQSKNNNLVTVQWGAGPSGTLKVVQVNTYGCMDSTTVDIAINPVGESEYALAESILKVYPNPVQDVMTIELTQFKREFVSFKLVSLEGKTVVERSVEVENENSTIILDVSHLADGMYLLQAESQGESMILPIIIGK
jgi:hypothetical protein